MYLTKPTQNSLPWLLHTVTRMHQNLIHTLFRERGLAEVSHPRLLFLIGRAEAEGQEIAQCHMAEMLGISPASVAVSLKRMEKSGLVIRQPAQHDNRRNVIRLSEKARGMIAETQQMAYDIDARLFEGFNEEERALLQDCFLRVIANLEARGATVPQALCQHEAQQKRQNCTNGASDE